MSNVSFCSPHLCVGFLFVILYPAASSASSSAASASHHLSHTTLSPTIFHTQLCHPPSLSHTTLSHTIFHTPSLSHTIFQTPTLSHTIFHTPSLSPTIFHTPSLSHTIFHTPTLSHTIFHTPSSRPPSFTHHFVTHHLSHTTLSHTIFNTQLWNTPSFTHHLCHTSSFTHHLWRHVPSFHVAGVALRDIHLRFAWQAWRLWHWAGSGGALGRAWARLVAGDAAQLCVAGVALGHIHLRFAWQAWHLVTSTFVLGGRRGTYGTGLAPAERLGALGRRWCRPTLRGRRGTWPRWRAWARLVAGDAAQLCVAGVALGDIHLRFAWQAWHLVTSTFVLHGKRGTCGTGLAPVARLGTLGRAWSPVTPPNFAWQAWHLVTSTFVLRGRHGTWSHPPSFCMASVALVALGWLRWCAWARLGALGRRWRRPTLRGRRGTWWHPPSFCVAGVALGQHLVTSTFLLRRKRGTYGTGLAPVARLGALGRAWSPVMPPNFAWQAWHLATSTFVSRGRCGTSSHPPSFCVASVSLMALGWLRWRAWARLVAGDAASLCVAGVALGHIHLRFAWQAWHLVTSTFVLRSTPGSGRALGRAWSPVTPPWHLVTFTFHRSSPVITSWRRVSCFDFDPPWEEIGCQAEMSVSSLYSVHVLCRFPFSYPAMNFSPCAVTAVSDMLWCLCTASWDPAHCSFATHHLSHTTFTHTHTRSLTQNFVTYTIFFVAHHLSHTTLSHTTSHTQLVLLLDPPPPPLSFLPSPSPLQHLLLIIGRSWLVGLSGPSIYIYAHEYISHLRTHTHIHITCIFI